MSGRFRISGSTLKLIAITAMLLDHIGAVILEPVIIQRAAVGGSQGLITADGLYQLYYLFRMVIGRGAFPVFCFLLTEGMQKSRDQIRYLVRLFCFALISELPFDLAITGNMWNPAFQNVYFTLAIGLGTMISTERLLTKSAIPFVRGGIRIGCLVAGICAAELLQTDYGGYGVLCIMVLYYFRRDRRVQLAAGAVAYPVGEFLFYGTSSELLAPLGFIPVALYNGERGWNIKYLFYVFYPLHLLGLYGIGRLFNI